MRENNELAGLRQSEIREKVQAYFKAHLDQYLDWLDRRGLSKSTLENVRCEMLDHESYLDMEMDSDHYLPVKPFLRKSGLTAQNWQSSQPMMQRELRKGRRDLLRAVLEAAERLEHYSYDGAPASALAATAPALPASSPLGAAVDDFIAEHSRQWAGKTIGQNRAYLNILVEYFGPDRMLVTITKQDASEVKKVLQALPSSRNTKPALKDLPLMEAVKVTGHKVISPKTINSHIQMFASFFDWAERHGHGPQKLFEKMKVAKARNAETTVKPYTEEQTALIFNELTDNLSVLVKKDSHKWGTLLGLFTGARLNEICQLDIADIQQEGDTWFLNITDEGDANKSVKAAASRRRVPLHSDLIRLGFLDFVESRKHGKRLFPDYSHNVNGGYGRNLGRWYNESFLPKLGIKKPGIVFHSLRHTMVTRLGQANVAEPIYQCIVGHARAGVTQQVYLREGFTLRQLSEAIEKFRV
ncbi:site-specific integrase [Loktanella sp. 3ANDIMAR09]|uniref:site-specific integrase n=1 Tax=Loktanella sp. 3ANDIMAR09 TaxID=1225657 RepID=UPI00209CEBA6|nr:site-specific integrase [Loktanella sp. 3ANDIMAR09]